MTSSRRYGRLLQATSLGLIGMLTVVGCGGSDTIKRDGSVDGGGEVQPIKAQLNADKATVSVGSVDVGKTSTAGVVKITNSGTAVAALTITPTDVTATGCPASLAINASCNLSITATPTAAGPILGSVTVAAAGANTLNIGVTGTATMPGNFSFSPSSIEVGNIAVGAPSQHVITVTANATLTGITAGVSSAAQNLKIDSTTCGATLAAGSTCAINITFAAAAAGKVTTDAVTITQGGVTKSVPVNANVLTNAKLIATPEKPALAAAPGATSAPIAINVGNIGGTETGQVTVTLSGDKATSFRIVEDKCTISKILPASSCNVTVVYAPAATAAAEEVAILTIADKGAGLSSAIVTLTGTPNLPSSLAITGGPDLGQVARGTTGAEVLFTVTNSSATPSGALTASISDASIIVSSNTCATVATLNKGETCKIGLKLNPAATAAPASIAALLTVTGSSGKASASVTGTILGSAALSANPTSISFGSLPVNQVSADQTITITNTGATSTGVLTVTKSGTGAAQVAIVGDTCNTATLVAAGTCNVVVRYSPTDTTGVNGSISVSDGTSSVSVAMVGTGLMPANFTVKVGAASASTVSMGSKAIGYVSAATTLTVEVPTTAGTDSGLISAALTGDNAADFAFVNNCLVSVVPGANCTINVTFTPSAVGERKAQLTINGAKGGTWPVVLSGVGLALVEITPDPLPTAPATGLDFGSTPNGSLGQNLKYKVTVRGATAIAATSTVASVALATTTPPDFINADNTGAALTLNPCNGATLGLTANTGAATGAAAGWSIVGTEWVCSFYIRFTPQTGRSTTAKTTTVTATATAGGTSSVTLTGIATGPLVFSNRASTDVLTLVLNNQGAAGVSQGPITVALSNRDDFDVISDGCTNTTLASGASCTIALTFTPASVGAKTGTVTATANNPDPREDEVATATVTGIAPPTYNVSISPNSDVNAPVDMGTVAQGNVGEWKLFTVSNPADAAKSGTLWYAVGGDYELYTLATAGVTAYPDGYCGDNNSKQLDGGAECKIAVRFKPVNTAAIGARAGTLTVKVGGAAGTPVLSTDGLGSIQLTGTATSQLTINPAALDFGSIPALGETFQETVITNTGLSALTLTIPVVAADPSVSNVSVAAASGGCTSGVSLAAGASCTLKYRFSGTTAGTSIGYAGDGTPLPEALTVTNGASVSAQVTVQGKVLIPADLERYGADDTNALNLGNVLVGTSSGIATLYFTNIGESPATGINASLTAGGPEFAIPAESDAVNPCNALPANTLPAKGICSVRVQLTPATAGAKSGTLSLVGTGVAGVTVTLAGVGHGGATAGVYADLVSAPGTTFATFEPTAVGLLTNKVYFTLRNNTTGALTFSNLTVTEFNETTPVSEFVLAAEATGGGTACSIAAGGILASSTCQFSVRFTPATYGTTDGRRYRWATINYSGAPIAGVMGPVLKPAKLQLSATSTDAVIVSGTTANFGQVLEGASETFAFTITNIGEAAAAGAVTPTLDLHAGASYATMTHDCPAQLGPAATCTATVTISSAADGLKNTTTLQAIGTGTESSAEIFTLSAKIVRPALLSITPVTGAGTDFGAGTYIGATDGTPVTFTIRNGVAGDTSNNRQDSGALAVSLSNASDFSIVTGSSTCYNTTTGLYKVLGGALAADLACTIVVQFNPRTVGARTATLSVTATPGSSLSANLTGTGLADLTVAPAGTEAAPAALSGGLTGTFTITNNGPNTTSALGTSIGGTNGDLFTITGNNCVGATLANLATCTVTVAFTGTSNATTAQTATLTVTDGTAANTVVAYTKVGGP